MIQALDHSMYWSCPTGLDTTTGTRIELRFWDQRSIVSDRPAKSTAQICGLTVALVFTTIFWWPPIASHLLPENLVWRNVAAQAADWFFCLVLMAIVYFFERESLESRAVQDECSALHDFLAWVGPSYLAGTPALERGLRAPEQTRYCAGALAG